MNKETTHISTRNSQYTRAEEIEVHSYRISTPAAAAAAAADRFRRFDLRQQKSKANPSRAAEITGGDSSVTKRLIYPVITPSHQTAHHREFESLPREPQNPIAPHLPKHQCTSSTASSQGWFVFRRQLNKATLAPSTHFSFTSRHLIRFGETLEPLHASQKQSDTSWRSGFTRRTVTFTIANQPTGKATQSEHRSSQSAFQKKRSVSSATRNNSNRSTETRERI